MFRVSTSTDQIMLPVSSDKFKELSLESYLLIGKFLSENSLLSKIIREYVPIYSGLTTFLV